MNLHKRRFVSLFLTLVGLFTLEVQADGIASVNSYVEIKSSATDFRARKQSTNGQRSTSGFDFIIAPERTDICQQGQSSSICTNTYSFSGLGYVPTGSSTSIVFADTPANSYLVFINDDHNSNTDRTSKIGEIVFDYEILGYWTDPSMTVDFDQVDKAGATYPTSSNNGYNARQTEGHVHYGSSTTSSTTSGDWVSIGSDKRTLRFGAKNGRPGDYIRVITRAANPTIDFNITSSNGAESVSSAALTVDLSFASSQDVTVNYAITGTATGSGTDYTLANGTLTISAGATSGTITIANIVNDSLDEPNETVIVTLSSPSNATLGSDSVHTYTINDNDSAPVVDFNTTSSNGAESVSSKAVTVDLSAASSQDVTVNYAVSGTATGSGTDYTLANGTLTISAGATSGTITIASIADDSLDEANETVILTLSSPSNATLGSDSVHTYTITDNDSTPVVDFNSTSSNGAESNSSADLTVDLSAASSQDVTVNYALTGSATGSGTDYTLANGTLTISAGATSGTITIANIVDDTITEGNETVIVTLSSPSNATLGSDDTHTYTITDNESTPVVDFNTTSSNGAESVSSKALTVELSTASAQNVTVNYTVTGTATGSGTDYTLANGTLTISAGATTGTITIAGIVDDGLDEANETVIVTLSSPSNATLGSDDAHTYTINDNDAAPVVDFNTTSSNGAESVSSKALTVDLSAASSQDVTVDYTVTGTATGSGTDYTLANGTLTISAGATSGTITIASIVDDSIDESDETVVLTLSNPSNATLGSDSIHTYTITDNENTPTIDFNTTSSNGAESVSSKAITVDLSGPSSKTVTIDYAVTGTATGSGTDYTLVSGTLSIAAGDTSGTITISNIVDDNADEPDETVIITLSSPSNATLGSDDTHTYTIADDDGQPTIDFNTTSSSGAEDISSVAITVDLSAASSNNITVNYAVTGTATGSGTDYTLANGTLTISAGATNGTITIAGIVDDSSEEGDETVIVTLSSPSNAILGNDSVHTYTITDNDGTPSIAFSDASSNASESISSRSVDVVIPFSSEAVIEVDYDVTGGTAGLGSDYSLSSGSVSVDSGAITGTITIPTIINDSEDEDDETIIITLSNPINATLGSTIVHTVIINDDDNPPIVDFNLSSSSGNEADSSKSIIIDLSATSGQDVSVDYVVSGTATGSGTDYTLADGTVTIVAGETTATITIAGIVDDGDFEGDETIILTLSNPSNATLGGDSVHTYTITDNDSPPVVDIDFNTTGSSGLESVSSADLTVDLSATSSQNVRVDYSITGTATGSGIDYTLADGTLTISAGSSSGTITISDIVDDQLDETNETVIVTLSNAVNATLGEDIVHTYTITDNDDLPAIDFNIISSESDEPSPSISITVDVSTISGRDISVDYQLTGTATGAGIDYNLEDSTLTIEAGESTGVITIPGIIDDDLAEDDETIIITLSNPINASLGDDHIHTHTILANDDDKRPILIATSPEDDSTRVPVDSDIILKFNKPVDCESGTINIESEDNSSSFSVSLPNQIVSGCGTEIITVNLPMDLEYETEYYVLIESTVFDDILGNSFKGISNKKEFNFKTPIILTDPTLKQPVIDNAKAMTQIATRWVDRNIDVISKRMKISSRQGLRVNFNNKIIDSIKTIGVSKLDNNFVEVPIVEFCSVDSSGPKTSQSLKIKVHLSKISSENIAVDFNVSGASGEENFSYGDGVLNIDAGLKSAIITIDDIPQDRYGFIQGDRKIILTLTESSNSLLGDNLIYSHTLTDDQKAWTDPSANHFCISDFNNPKLPASVLAQESSNLESEATNSQLSDSDMGLADINGEIQTKDVNNNQDQGDSNQDLEQLKSTIKAWASDPVSVTADGELKEVLGNWSVWINGEFGEFTLGKKGPRSRILNEKSFHIGIDKLMNDDGDIFGFALGLGEDKPADMSHESHMESRNYSFSTYGKFDDRRDALQFIFGISKLEFYSDRLDGEELLRGEREANQVFGSLALIRSFSNESSNWQISPYFRLDGSYTQFDKFSEIGGEAALTFDELTLSNAKASIGTDISFLFTRPKYNVMPYMSLEYGLDYSETTSQSMFYTVEGASKNYTLELDDGMKAHNWEVDIGLMLEIFTAMNTTIGCRWQGRSSYLSNYSSVSNNDISSSEVCFVELMWNF